MLYSCIIAMLTYVSIWKIEIHTTRCRPSNGWQCIPNVIILEHVESTYLSDFSSLAQIKIQVKYQFQTFLRKNWICGFLCYSTCEDLPIDVLITKVGLILTKLRWFQLFGTSQNSISIFFEKKNQIFRFPCCSSCEDLSIDVSITDVGLILTKPGWFLFSG